MRNPDRLRWLRREIEAALRFAPWLAIAVLLMAVLWEGDLAAMSGLFQSPASSFESPISSPTPPASPTTAPTEVPTATPTATATPEGATPAPPTDTPLPTATVEATAACTPTWTPSATLEPTVPSVEDTVTPVATPADSGGRYPEGESNLVFELGMLFDSVALGLSYLWLCCGVLVMIGIPVAFVILWVASKRHLQEGAAEIEEQSVEEQPAEE